MNTYDVEQLANALISSADETPGPEWRGYARTCFIAVARRCKQSGAPELTELWSRVIEELQEGKRRPLSWPGCPRRRPKEMV